MRSNDMELSTHARTYAQPIQLPRQKAHSPNFRTPLQVRSVGWVRGSESDELRSLGLTESDPATEFDSGFDLSTDDESDDSPY